jgi:hypothetical protein
MIDQIYKRFLILSVITMLVVSGVMLVGEGSADVSAQAGATKTLDRDLEPVILNGARVSALVGEPTNSLYIYVFNGDSLNTAPIPAQVDEVAADGSYTASEDGVLDANDEIVFLAKDTGDQPSDTSPLNSLLDINTSNWYEITVVDPTTGKRGWAYLVRRNSSASISGDYVDYGSGMITSTPHRYQLGFSDTHFGFDFLTLPNNDTADVLDRTKVRVTLGVTVTEEDVPFSPPDPTIDGRVRAVVEQNLFGTGVMTTTYLAYGSMIHSLINLESAVSVSSVRTSVDLNSGAAGSTFYNQNVSGGVTVDGSPDAVAATPFSKWAQISHPNGRVIQVVDATPIGGTPKNYYCDDAASSLECDGTSKTGDGSSYGDAGILVDGGLNQDFVFASTLYVLPPAGGGDPDNVGAIYEGYFSDPLFPIAFLKGEPNTTYLPLVLKGS